EFAIYNLFSTSFRLKAQHEGELGSILQAAARRQAVKTYAIVEPEQAKHGQVKAHAQACRAAQAERIILVQVTVTVGRLQEGQPENGGAGVQAERITQ